MYCDKNVYVNDTIKWNGDKKQCEIKGDKWHAGYMVNAHSLVACDEELTLLTVLLWFAVLTDFQVSPCRDAMNKPKPFNSSSSKCNLIANLDNRRFLIFHFIETFFLKFLSFILSLQRGLRVKFIRSVLLPHWINNLPFFKHLRT